MLTIGLGCTGTTWFGLCSPLSRGDDSENNCSRGRSIRDLLIFIVMKTELASAAAVQWICCSGILRYIVIARLETEHNTTRCWKPVQFHSITAPLLPNVLVRHLPPCRNVYKFVNKKVHYFVEVVWNASTVLLAITCSKKLAPANALTRRLD